MYSDRHRKVRGKLQPHYQPRGPGSQLLITPGRVELGHQADLWVGLVWVRF